jgi:hypothetical protein
VGFPVILVDSNSGSDTLASGAGPATALTGSAASTSSNGLTVTLDGSPDLTDVATDGTHIIFLNDSTAGNRNFGKITAKDNSAKTVTVANAFGFSLSGKAWAIGGKRGSIGSATSNKLFDNNGAAGDAMPGWVVEMQSGHAETLSSSLNTRRAGDTTSGGIILRGVAGSATRPILTFSGGGNLIVPRGNYQVFKSFDIKDTSGHTGTCFKCTVADFTTVEDVRADDATSYPSSFADVGGSGIKFLRCRIKSNGKGITTLNPVTIEGCDFHNCGDIAIDATGSDNLGMRLRGNLIRACANGGIVLDLLNGANNRSISVIGNTIDGCTGATADGIQVKGTVNDVLGNIEAVDNIISNNGRYGLNFTTASDGQVSAYSPSIRNNNTFNNTSGAYNSTTASYTNSSVPWATGDFGFNPSYTSTALGDYTPMNSSLSGKSFPGGVGGTTGTSISYAYPGAVQPMSVRPPRFRLGIKR